MKKNILRSLEPQTKSLFRFKNYETKKHSNIKTPDTTGIVVDPTLTTTAFTTH